MKYHSFYDDKEKNLKIDPLHFFENDGGLYLLTNTTRFGEIRTLAVERIQEMEKAGSSFEYPVGFNPEELLESSFDIIYEEPIDVIIWFSADQALYIKERKWSRSQKIEDQEDGSIIPEMLTSGRWDVVRWVLKYGGEAKILEPKELEDEIIKELRSAQTSYEDL